MANKPITMNKLKTVIRLHAQGKGKKFIAKYLDLSRNTVKKYILAFYVSQLSFEQVAAMSDAEMYKLFQAPKEFPISQRQKALLDFYPKVERELKKPGVTRILLWKKYRALHPDGYGRTQFFELYRKWRGTTNPSMHVVHKAGDKMYVDYAGKKLQIVNAQTGEYQDVEVFVSILGASQLIYVEASPSQRKEDFVYSVENAMHYYGGVPLAVVPDNLKSAVQKSHRYEPTLNETFEDFADHYSTIILPARVYKPKDKALVEGAVKIVYQSIYTALQDKQFLSLDQLNHSISMMLEQLNDRELSVRNASRRELFEQIEKQHMKPLPAERYEIKETTWATVTKNGHICLHKDKHYYSVPYQYIGKKVKVVWSSRHVNIYHHHERLATHLRDRTAYAYTSIAEHLIAAHRFVQSWDPEFFRNWARKIHPDVERLILAILESKRYPEQAYRVCMGVLSLTKKVGEQRLAAACSRALQYNACDYKTVYTILNQGLDQLEDDQVEDYKLPGHRNIRGQEYYA